MRNALDEEIENCKIRILVNVSTHFEHICKHIVGTVSVLHCVPYNNSKSVC